eukprot:jgi/Chlat1/832/Chrsp104S01288
MALGIWDPATNADCARLRVASAMLDQATNADCARLRVASAMLDQAMNADCVRWAPATSAVCGISCEARLRTLLTGAALAAQQS